MFLFCFLKKNILPLQKMRRMKKFHYIITWVILLVGIPACQRHTDYPHSMQQAETLMDTRPDSALCLLQSMADSLDMLPDEAQMYYHLLTIQAKDKQYITHTNDSLINHIVSFYEDYDDKERLMLAYYYQGSVYRDLNDAPRALKAFQQVLDLDEGCPPCDLFARTYNQMGTLFAYQSLYDESLEANKQSVQQYLLQGKKNKTSYALRDMARMYNLKEQRDSASHYYQKAYQTAVTANDSNRMNKIKAEWGCYMIDDSSTREAGKQILLSFVKQGKTYLNILSNLGSLYRHEGKWDSAYHFLEKMKSSSIIKRRQAAFQDLAFIESQKGNLALAVEYGKQANALRDSIEKMTQTEALAKIHSLYQYQHIEKENLRLKEANTGKMLVIYTLSSILAIFIALVIAYYFYIKQQAEKRARQADNIKHLEDKQYAQSQAAIKDNQRKIEELEQEAQPTEAPNTLEHQLRQAQKETLERTNQQIEATQTERELQIMALKQSKIYNRFHHACHDSNIKLTEKDWSELVKAIDIAYPGFSGKLYVYCPKLSNIELQICCLIKISIPISDIATLIGRTRSAVTLARIRLYKKMQGEDGKAEELDRFILGL